MFDSDQFISIFLNEAQEIVDGLENDLVILEDNKTDSDLLNKIFRSAHTLKSSAGTVGFEKMSEINHVAENLLEKVRSGKLEVNADIITVLLEFLDTVKLMLNNIVEGKNEADGITTMEGLKARIKAVADGGSVSSATVATEQSTNQSSTSTDKVASVKQNNASNIKKSGKRNFNIFMKFKSNIFDNGIDPLMFINDLKAIGDITHLFIDTSDVPHISNMDDPYQCYTKFEVDIETEEDITAIQTIFLFVIDDNDIIIKELGESKTYNIKMEFKPNIFDNGIDPLMFINDLKAIGKLTKVDIDFDEVPQISDLDDPYKCYTKFEVELKTAEDRSKIDTVFLFVVDDNNITITCEDDMAGELIGEEDDDGGSDDMIGEEENNQEDGATDNSSSEDSSVKGSPQVAATVQRPTPAQASQGAQTVRVDTRKLDTMMNLVGELVIAQSRIMQITAKFEGGDDKGLKESVASIDRITRQIQEEVMNIRMMPIGPIFTQFHRYIRDLSIELNKDIKLVLKGETTEIDKNMLEQLSDPLKHIIRNSIDHGIEKTKEERVARGKPEHGTITLSAAHQEGHVVIEVSDDGNGLNKERILAKGIEKGILSKDAVYSDGEIYRTIFAPGFSTADKITDISGRGVGMDVVRVNVEKMKGRIEINTEPGKGTTMIIKLPLTLAIIEGITFALGSEIFVMPLLSIVEQLKVKDDSVKPFEGRGEMINIRGEYIPLIRLHKVFNVDTNVTKIDDGIVVVAEAGYRRCALFVDELLDQQQAVIKSLDQAFKKHSGIAGGTILGDGKIALIIDIQGLVNSSLQGKISNGNSSYKD